jgi:hypothetical protein
MQPKLDPAVPSDWQDYYSSANKRRRAAGWHRRGEVSSSRRKRIDPSRLLAIVMGIAALTVILCLVIPT